MTSPIWEKCQGSEHIQLLQSKAWRVVEDQSCSSTRELVDTLEEHEILENLIEEKSKPPLPTETEFKGYHYLLITPFRYPPLRYGSRFGHRYERSLWYGAEELETSLGEAAFYRFLFFSGTKANLLPCLTFHSTYFVPIKTTQGMSLTCQPFSEYQAQLSKKESYADSQPLGSSMREANIEGFTYYSARVENKINIGLFTPLAFASKTIHSLQHWQCYTDNQRVEFIRHHLKTHKVVYEKTTFLKNGVLPFDQALA